MNKKALINKADEYIDKCNVFPSVYAKEGGIMELNSLLVDFIGYVATDTCDCDECVPCDVFKMLCSKTGKFLRN